MSGLVVILMLFISPFVLAYSYLNDLNAACVLVSIGVRSLLLGLKIMLQIRGPEPGLFQNITAGCSVQSQLALQAAYAQTKGA